VFGLMIALWIGCVDHISQAKCAHVLHALRLLLAKMGVEFPEIDINGVHMKRKAGALGLDTLPTRGAFDALGLVEIQDSQIV
jgi:hypothetical protein